MTVQFRLHLAQSSNKITASIKVIYLLYKMCYIPRSYLYLSPFQLLPQ